MAKNPRTHRTPLGLRPTGMSLVLATLGVAGLTLAAGCDRDPAVTTTATDPFVTTTDPAVTTTDPLTTDPLTTERVATTPGTTGTTPGIGQPGPIVTGPLATDRDPAVETATPASGTQMPADTQGMVGEGMMSSASFVSEAASLSRFIVLTSETALQKQLPAEDQAFARREIDFHRGLLERLEGAAEGMTVHSEPTPEQTRTIQQLADADAAAFEGQFHTQMTQAHEQLVTLFERAGNQLPDGRLQEVATATLPDLRAHLQEIRAHDHRDHNHAQ